MKKTGQEISIRNESLTTSTVHIQSGVIRKLDSVVDINKYSQIFIVADVSVDVWLQELIVGMQGLKFTIFARSFSDSTKNIEIVSEIWSEMHDAKCDRKSLLINLGGGVVSDLGGFCASTYMRGMDYINIPTSLLAQVDASFGGKTGFNFAGIKNLIGTFTDPIKTIIDPETLNTLPEREYISGFAELIKHGVICDKSFFELVTSKKPLEFSSEQISDIIYRSCLIKKSVTEQDRTEQASRKLLNFGHTVGHAIEIQSLEGTMPLLHGEAVSIGMVAEAMIAVATGKLTSADLKSLTKALERAGLPTAMAWVDVAELIRTMRSDKKNEGQELHFTLIDRIGYAQVDQVIAESIVVDVLHAINESRV